MRPLFLLFALTWLFSQEPPDWVISGIAWVETESVISPFTGRVLNYTNQKRGAHGERGPFQMKEGTFRDMLRPGEDYVFSDIAVHPEIAKMFAIRYLKWLRRRAPSWERAVEYYNAGPGNRSRKYLAKVKQAGGVQ